MPENIPLAESIICIDPDAKLARVLASPDETRIRDSYPYVFGACDPYWADCNIGTLIGELLIQVWQVCIDHDIPAVNIHQELQNIIEYRDLMDID